VEPIINIYCDESGQLENDRQPVMVLGAVWCPSASASVLSARLRGLKRRHDLNPRFEVKWSKVSPAKAVFYVDWLNDFFREEDLHFRAVIAPKTAMRPDDYGIAYEDWYYKLYFDLLKVLLSPACRYRIYLDQKDLRGREKTARLNYVLAHNLYDFPRTIIERIQIIRSRDTELLQLADLLTGTVAYANRGLHGNPGKNLLVQTMRLHSGYELTKTTLYREDKVNLFKWIPQETAA